MGYYLQTGSNLDKADALVAMYGAEIISKPRSFAEVPANKALICVVSNGIFEAAGYCFSPAEFDVFADPSDYRRKWWLLMDLDKAQELSKFKESYDYKCMQGGSRG